MKELLNDSPDHLFEPENIESLVTVLRRQIGKRVVLQMEAPTWTDMGRRLDDFFELVLSGKADRKSSG